MEKASVSVRKPTIEVIGFLSRRRLHLERSPSGTRHCSQPENADFLSEMFPDRHSHHASQFGPERTAVSHGPKCSRRLRAIVLYVSYVQIRLGMSLPLR